MKKIFALILAVMMIATMSVTAFAAETVTTNDGKVDITVNGIYEEGSFADYVISVDVSWDAMTFTYTEGSQGTWNPETHSYDDATAAGWSTDTATITVTNHSNILIYATCSFEATATGVVGTFDGETTKELIVDSADDDAYRTAVDGVYPAPSQSTEFGISGAAISADATLGTITVTIVEPA